MRAPTCPATMAALDKALDQAERLSSMLGLSTETPASDTEAMEGVIDLPDEPDLPPVPTAATPPPPPPFDAPSSPPM